MISIFSFRCKHRFTKKDLPTKTTGKKYSCHSRQLLVTCRSWSFSRRWVLLKNLTKCVEPKTWPAEHLSSCNMTLTSLQFRMEVGYILSKKDKLEHILFFSSPSSINCIFNGTCEDFSHFRNVSTFHLPRNWTWICWHQQKMERHLYIMQHKLDSSLASF